MQFWLTLPISCNRNTPPQNLSSPWDARKQLGVFIGVEVAGYGPCKTAFVLRKWGWKLAGNRGTLFAS